MAKLDSFTNVCFVLLADASELVEIHILLEMCLLHITWLMPWKEAI